MISPPLTYDAAGRALTEGFEGYADQAYWDDLGKVWTIGYGHTAGVKEGDSCNLAQADQWVLEDSQAVADAINRDCSFADLTQDEFDALVDFGFNLGIGALEGSTLWRKLMAGDLKGADAEFARWDRAGGKEVPGLERRRLAEANLFNSNGGDL